MSSQPNAVWMGSFLNKGESQALHPETPNQVNQQQDQVVGQLKRTAAYLRCSCLNCCSDNGLKVNDLIG